MGDAIGFTAAVFAIIVWGCTIAWAYNNFRRGR